MYSCNWMFNVAEAGTYVIDTQTTTTFTIVSALVKYYDTTKPDISTCTVRLNSASSVSGIINETLQNKDVVIVQNVPFTITGGRELYLYTTAAVSLMLSVISTETRPAPGPIPVPFEIKNCTIRNPPWWEKYVMAKDRYDSFKQYSYTFTSNEPIANSRLDTTNTEIGFVWNDTKVHRMPYLSTIPSTNSTSYVSDDVWHIRTENTVPGKTFISLNSMSVYEYYCWLRRVRVDPEYPVYRWILNIEIRETRDASGNNYYDSLTGPIVYRQEVYSELATAADDPATLRFRTYWGREGSDFYSYTVSHYFN